MENNRVLTFISNLFGWFTSSHVYYAVITYNLKRGMGDRGLTEEQQDCAGAQDWLRVLAGAQYRLCVRLLWQGHSNGCACTQGRLAESEFVQRA